MNAHAIYDLACLQKDLDDVSLSLSVNMQFLKPKSCGMLILRYCLRLSTNNKVQIYTASLDASIVHQQVIEAVPVPG